MRKALTLALLSTALALLLLPAPARATTPQPTSAEKKMIELVNAERARHGLAPVRFNASLTRAARAHSSEMARRNTLTHTSANGATITQRLIKHGYTRSGYRSWSAGENVARARTGTLFSTPSGVVSSWMSSTGHRQVVLKREFRDVGIGISTSASGMRYFTLDMGRRVL
jgi:uncharacterized protein YkwD